MKEKIFTKKETVIIGLIAFVLIFSFCWFELRPYIARKDCINEAWKYLNTSNQPMEKTFEHCMLKKGYK